MWKSLAAGRESHARRQKTEEMATQQETGTDQVSHLDKNMTAMVQQCSVSMMTARDVQPSTSSFSQLVFPKIPIFAHACVHEHMNGRESGFYCNVQGGWFKPLCRKLTHLLLSEKMFNTIVIPPFSRKVRQHIQNLPAQYFLNTGNVLRKFSFETRDCNKTDLQLYAGYLESLWLGSRQERGGGEMGGRKNKLAWRERGECFQLI